MSPELETSSESAASQRSLVLTGIPRSGTSLLAALLSKIDNCYVFNEIFYDTSSLSRDLNSQRARLIDRLPIRNKFDVEGNLETNTIQTTEQGFENVQDRVAEGDYDENCVVGSKVNTPYLVELDSLVSQNFVIYGILRNPVYTIASWIFRNVPSNFHCTDEWIPKEHIPIDFKAVSVAKASILERQIILWVSLSKILFRFQGMGKLSLVQYETLVEGPTLLVNKIARRFALPEISEELNVQSFNSSGFYETKGVDIDAITTGLREFPEMPDEARRLYPEIF